MYVLYKYSAIRYESDITAPALGSFMTGSVYPEVVCSAPIDLYIVVLDPNGIVAKAFDVRGVARLPVRRLFSVRCYGRRSFALTMYLETRLRSEELTQDRRRLWVETLVDRQQRWVNSPEQ